MSDFIKRILSSIILLPLVIYFILMGSFYLIFLIVICFFAASYEWHKMVKNRMHMLIGYFFLTLSFYSFYKLSIEKYIITPLLICIATDIGGYVFGKIFKGPKLTKISPNKTYAGMIGGYFLSIMSFIIYSYYINEPVTLLFLIIVIFISSISQIGDIVISYFKRLSNLKNTGMIIPGHGGILDRIDGMLFAIPVFYLIHLIGFSI
ncbi:phosphatidate cytidylyltransferase [Candidatus Pelagibacter sp.]|nr:phosphatidate cytidylyltransferase [Candidatus Pelagibacter sp.]